MELLEQRIQARAGEGGGSERVRPSDQAHAGGKRYAVGYAQGAFDMLHVGHLNLLEKASGLCARLVVGVNSDELIRNYKNKEPVIREDDRCRLVKALSCVDDAFVVDTLDKLQVASRIKFDAIFIGDDWKGNDRWKKTEEDLRPLGIDVVYLPYTQGISCTMLRPLSKNRVEG